MLRVTLRRLSVSPYSLFMVEQKKNPALQGAPITLRGRLLGRLYRKLSPADRASLEKRAARHPSFKRKVKKRRVPSAYTRFVKRHMNAPALRGLPPSRRMKAIAAMWSDKGGARKVGTVVAIPGRRAVKKAARAAKDGKKPKPAKRVMTRVSKRVNVPGRAKINGKSHKAKTVVRRPKVRKAKNVKRAYKASSSSVRTSSNMPKRGKRSHKVVIDTRNLTASELNLLNVLIRRAHT